MICPHCHNEISDTAIRCRYCRQSVFGDIKKKKFYHINSFIETLQKTLKSIFLSGKDLTYCPWKIFDVIILTILITVFVLKDPLHIGTSIIKFLRTNFFIVIKEPKLLYYLAISINTIILKIISMVFLIFIVRFRKISFTKTVIPWGKVPDCWRVLLPLYLVVCVVLWLVNSSNPLLPDIPFNSVFIEAKIIGNIVIIFSILFVAPFIEEILFRGFLYPAVNKYWGIYPSIMFTAALFTFAHYPQIKDDLSIIISIFTLSVIITYARAKTGSMWIAIGMHFLYNLTCVVMGFTDYFILKFSN